MAKGIYNINDIDDYSDWEDFCSDWCNENIGYTRTQARKLLHGGKGEFVIFSNREIIRLSM